MFCLILLFFMLYLYILLTYQYKVFLSSLICVSFYYIVEQYRTCTKLMILLPSGSPGWYVSQQNYTFLFPLFLIKTIV